MIPTFLATVGVIAAVALTLYTVWALGVGRGEQLGWDEAFRLHLESARYQSSPLKQRRNVGRRDLGMGILLWAGLAVGCVNLAAEMVSGHWGDAFVRSSTVGPLAIALMYRRWWLAERLRWRWSG